MGAVGGLTNSLPLLRPEFIMGLEEAYVPQPKKYVMQQFYPLTPVDTRNVKWDERSPLNYGLTLPSVPGAESPIIKGGHLKQFEVEPIHFREKYVFRQDEAVALRQPGTTGGLMSPPEMVAEKHAWIRGRIQDRFEWMGWNAARGRIAINENNVNVTYNYNIPAHLNVTLAGNNRWNQAATANPLNDIMSMMALSRGFGWRFGSCWMNAATADVALQITQFRNFFRDAMQGGVLTGTNIFTIDLLEKILKVHLRDTPEIMVWDEGYYIERPITVHANTGAFAVTVDDATFFEQGDQVTLVGGASNDQQLMTLNGGPVGNQLNFLTATTATYEVGSVVRAHKKHIPDGLVFFMPEFGPGIPTLGKTFLTPTEWSPGSLMAPKPGVFFETHDHTNEDPKRIELIGGFEGISVPTHTGIHAMLNVY